MRVPARSGISIPRAVLQSFREFPPRQKPASFNLEQVIQKLSTGASNANN